ncbi:MAG: hypothetical protein M9962_04755 [Oligoflexia bacterium]|nr:hypothetical protein [Oligoflexia bacterium]
MDSKASFRPVLGNAINFLLSAKGLFLLLFFQAIYLSPLVADWLGFIVDEGYTLDAAQRILKGEVPHRDFFFLWTPGTAYLHAFLDWLGFGWLQSRWVAALVAALTSSILFSHFSKLDIGRSRFFFYFLLLFWNFSLWGFPYSSWYAVFFVALSFYFINKNFLLMGALLGFSFWFKQNVGILSFLFVVGGLFLKDRKSLFRFIFAFIATVLIPFFILCIFYGKDFFSHFINQIFIFPLTYQKVMFQGLPWQQMGSPLVTIGLWLLCLIFSHQKALPKNIRAMTLVLVLYTTIMIWSRSQTYFYGLFFSASLFIFIISLIYFCVNFKKMKQEETILFL